MARPQADADEARGRGSALVGDRLFVVGGWNNDIFVEANEEYDAAANTWTSRAPLPVGQNHVSLVEYGGLLYSLGAAEGPEKFRYDPATDSWQAIAPMLSYRSYAPACVAGDRIYVCGGWQTPWSFTNSNQEYDPASDSWAWRQPMPTPRFGHVATVVEGKLYAIGGFNGQALNANEEYDPSTDSWRARAPLPTARWSATVAVLNGRILVLGGYRGSPGNYDPNLTTDAVEAFDPGTDEWTSQGSLPAPVTEPTAVAMDEGIMVIGGLYTDFLDSARLWIPEQKLFMHRRE